MSDPAQGMSGQGKPEKVLKWIRSQSLLSVDQGPLVRQVIGFLVMAVAAVVAVWFLLNWCRLLPDVRYMSFVEGLGYVLLLLGLLLAVGLALAVMAYRGWQTRALPASDYTFGPILGMLAGMWGDMTLVFMGVMSLPVMLATWCDAQSLPLPLLWNPGRANRFLDGVSMFLACWVTGLAALVAGRWIKEWLGIIVQVAQDVHAIRQK